MAQYIVNLQVDGRNINNADGSLIALTVPSGQRIKIVRVRISVNSVSSINAVRVKLARCSANLATHTSKTPVKKDPSSPASTVTCDVKTAGVTYSANTIVDLIDDVSFVGRGMYQWEAIDEDDCIIIDSSILNFTILQASTDTASENYCATVEWIEE